MIGTVKRIAFVQPAESDDATRTAMAAMIQVARAAGHEALALAAPHAPMIVEGPPRLIEAYELYLFLKNSDPRFDAVIAPLRGGLGYCAALGAAEGLLPASFQVVVLANSATLYEIENARKLVDRASDLERDFMERESAAWASWMILENQDLGGWLGDAGWKLAPAVSGKDWLRRLGEESAAPRAAAPPDSPTVSICATLFNRAQLLPQALASVQAQEVRPTEIVVVDDGSTSPEALALLGDLEKTLPALGGRVIRHPGNRGLGAARNTGIRESTGKYILFLDDDDVMRPEMLGTLARAAEGTGADMVVACADRFEGEAYPEGNTHVISRIVPLGGSLITGIFRNSFGGGSCALFRRELFDRVGEFAEGDVPRFEDWEFFAAALLRGATMTVVPEALLWYRQSPDSLNRRLQRHADSRYGLAPFEEALPPSLRLLPSLCRGQDAAINRLEAEKRRYEESYNLLLNKFPIRIYRKIKALVRPKGD